VWLVNTGWSGGRYGVGKRISLRHTRAIIDAIHNGSLATARTTPDPVFGFDVVAECPNVPDDILLPRGAWSDPSDYDAAARRLAGLFRENFSAYEAGVGDEIKAAGPYERSASITG
jgi:phosphoenolpyruvate carboxykinase (ATP)